MTSSTARRVLLGCAVLAGSMYTGGHAASAAPIEREQYSYTDAGSFDDCGFEIDWTREAHGLFMLKEGRAGDPTPYLFDNYAYKDVFTNPVNGTWFTREGDGLYKDLRIVNVEGTVYRFESVELGQPFVIRDSEGNVVMRDRGLLRTGFTVDTQGDSDLGNDVFIDDSQELLADHGRHPGFYADFCDIARDLIG